MLYFIKVSPFSRRIYIDSEEDAELDRVPRAACHVAIAVRVPRLSLEMAPPVHPHDLLFVYDA